MKRFSPLSPAKKSLLFGSICAVALTGLIVANATSEFADHNTMLDAQAQGASLEMSANYADAFESEAEVQFLESLGDPSDDESLEELFAKKGKKWKEEFSHTEKDGLQARNPFCERFIDNDGKYGVYGKVIATYLGQKYKKSHSTPMLADDLVGMVANPSICPNWRAFDTDQRIKFWAWTFAAMASVESSCGASKGAVRGVRGVPVRSKSGKIVRYKTAIGLLQMEKAKSDRAWRDIPTCDVDSSLIGNSYYNLRCGIDIMEGLVSGEGAKDPWPIYPGKGMEPRSYWLHLRERSGGQIGSLIRAYKPCRGKFVAGKSEAETDSDPVIDAESIKVPLQKTEAPKIEPVDLRFLMPKTFRK